MGTPHKLRIWQLVWYKLIVPVLLLVLAGQFNPVFAVENCDKFACSSATQSQTEYLQCNTNKQNCLQETINEIKNNSNTLKNAISILNGQISLQQLQIDQTLAEIKKLEDEIDQLSDVITGLSNSLDRMTGILIERIGAQYKHSRQASEFSFLFSGSFNDLIERLKYFTITQHQTAQTMQMTESRRLVFDEQKQLKEKKQQELAEKRTKLVRLQENLKSQKKEQQFILNRYQNDEAKFQSELAATLAERMAIQAIIAGKGTEEKVGEVKRGDVIASIIIGRSVCSTGTHLHFEVVKNGMNFNPADYLKNESIVWRNEPDGSFGFSGAWSWPLFDPAEITQGYGMTYYARQGSYNGSPHTGIDMVSKNRSNNQVVAVSDGTLYRGSAKCGGGYLRYVKVAHRDDSASTYYLHVNY